MLKVIVIYCFNCGYTSIISGLSIDLLYNYYRDGFNKAIDNMPEDF
jgi:hypothetical protein